MNSCSSLVQNWGSSRVRFSKALRASAVLSVIASLIDLSEALVRSPSPEAVKLALGKLIFLGPITIVLAVVYWAVLRIPAGPAPIRLACVNFIGLPVAWAFYGRVPGVYDIVSASLWTMLATLLLTNPRTAIASQNSSPSTIFAPSLKGVLARLLIIYAVYFYSALIPGIAFKAARLLVDNLEYGVQLVAWLERYSVPAGQLLGVVLLLLLGTKIYNGTYAGIAEAIAKPPSRPYHVFVSFFLGCTLAGVFRMVAGDSVSLLENGSVNGFLRGVPLLLTCLTAPFLEETVFTGATYTSISLLHRPYIAALLTIFAFVGAHTFVSTAPSYWQIVYPSFYGLLAVAVRIRTHSVWPAIGAHLGYNIVICL